MNNYDAKILKCGLCDSILRNINDHFINISFDILKGNIIQVKVILDKRTEVEDEYIDEICVEFEAAIGEDIINPFEITTDIKSMHRFYVVYNRKMMR